MALAHLLSLLHASKASVEELADAAPEQGEAIAASAGMAVRKAAARTKAPFAAKPGARVRDGHSRGKGSRPEGLVRVGVER